MNYALALHFLTLLVLAAGSIGSVLLHIALSRAVRERPLDAIAIAKLGALFGPTATFSALAMVVSGLLLLGARAWVDLSALWFMLKAALFVALMLNGRFVAAPTGGRLVGALMARAAATDATPQALASANDTVARAMHTLQRFHLTQSIGLSTMVLLAVFRPQ